MHKTEYSLFHNQSHYHHVSAPMTQQFCGITKDKVITLPPDIGSGYFRYTSPCTYMKLYLCDVTFNKNTVLCEQTRRSAFSLCFCFSDRLEWGKTGNQLHLYLKKGECCIYQNGHYEMNNYYEAGQRYVGIGIDLHPCRFRPVTDLLLKRNLVMIPEQPDFVFHRYQVSKPIEDILLQIIRCSYIDDLKSLYLEGKILELTSVFTNEVILGKEAAFMRQRMNLSDNGTLEQIKQILDESFAEPLTISRLAKQSFMSESKLRQAFKQRYGITIYQYILDCKMEKAKELLTSKNYQVKDAASLVGYSNFSHFSEAFRKKYGSTPSNYMKS